MTIEEAIKTIEVAIAEVEWEYPMDYAVAFDMAIAALREQQEREKNEALTPGFSIIDTKSSGGGK